MVTSPTLIAHWLVVFWPRVSRKTWRHYLFARGRFKHVLLYGIEKRFGVVLGVDHHMLRTSYHCLLPVEVAQELTKFQRAGAVLVLYEAEEAAAAPFPHFNCCSLATHTLGLDSWRCFTPDRLFAEMCRLGGQLIRRVGLNDNRLLLVTEDV